MLVGGGALIPSGGTSKYPPSLPLKWTFVGWGEKPSSSLSTSPSLTSEINSKDSELSSGVVSNGTYVCKNLSRTGCGGFVSLLDLNFGESWQRNVRQQTFNFHSIWVWLQKKALESECYKIWGKIQNKRVDQCYQICTF